jgi:predicted HicB family RNase H-like nuclease
MARPKKGSEKKLSCDFRVRITEELRKALDERVAAENSTITDIVTPILERELLGERRANRRNLEHHSAS